MQSNDSGTTSTLTRTIGLTGATFTLIGFVVGGSIFVLPGELATSAGPAVTLAYLFAALATLPGCVLAVQISNVFPTSGANYVSVSRVVSPLFGFVTVWMMMPLVALSIAPLFFGIADYAAEIIPQLGGFRREIAWISLIAIFILNLYGVKTTVRAQSLMVLFFIAVLLIFGVASIFFVNPDNYQPYIPNGGGKVVEATIAAFFSFTGFALVMSLGGEIKNPRRNIPLAVGGSFLAVLIMYLLINIAVTGLIPWNDPEIAQAGVTKAARIMLPDTLVSFVSLAAFFAILTSINGALLATSREIFMLAKSRLFPKPLDYVSREHHEPVGAICFMTGLIALGLLLERSFAEYATMVVVLAMVPQILSALVLIMIPYRVPELYAAAEIRLPKLVLAIISIVIILISLFFIVIGIATLDIPFAVFFAYLAAGGLYYFVRSRWLKKEGVDVRQILLNSTATHSTAAKP